MKPILFSTQMVQSILEGRKTMTRRIIKPQPKLIESSGRWYWEKALDVNGSPLVDASRNWWEYYGTSPYGKVGEVLWVRETWVHTGAYFIYKAGNKWSDEWLNDDYVPTGEKIKWKPSIFMPKEACRIFLEITDIRVERLQEISEEDAIKEGISKCRPTNSKKGMYHTAPIGLFKELWQSINGKESWDSNPFVWVIEFKRIDKSTIK